MGYRTYSSTDKRPAQRVISWALAFAMLIAIAATDAAAEKRSRSRSKAAKTSVKKEKKSRSSKRERGSRAESRKGKRGRKSDRIARRRGRRNSQVVARSSRERQNTSEVEEPTAPPQPRSLASGISSERVTEIQNALIQAGVLAGPASGTYDEGTSDAMKKFQSRNGLPTTGLPSAHTLKRLGVSKRSNDGYAVPVTTASKEGKSRPQAP